jgi:hypothetical protein
LKHIPNFAPLGFFDRIGFAEKADDNTLKRYREAEFTHGRVGTMLAIAGFLAGEAVAGSSFLFDGSITGPAINHLAQVPPALAFFAIVTTKVELDLAQYGWANPGDAEDLGMLASIPSVSSRPIWMDLSFPML